MLSIRVIFALTAGCLFATAAPGQTVWDMPTGYAPNNFHTKNIVDFVEDVKKATGGELVINVHPGGSLYAAPQIKRAVQTRQVQIGEVLMVLLSNEDAVFGIDGLPFLAQSYDEAQRLAELQRPYVEALLEQQGLVYLFSVPWPPQGLHSDREVTRASDLAGVPFRAYSRQTARLGELMGARPTTIQAAEVTQALATGRVKAFFASAQSGIDYSVWETLRYFYDVQGWLPKNMVAVSRSALEALEPGTRAALLEEAREAEARGWEASKRTAEETKRYLAERGIEVRAPGPELVEDFREIGEQMYQEWLQRAGEQARALAREYRARD